MKFDRIWNEGEFEFNGDTYEAAKWGWNQCKESILRLLRSSVTSFEEQMVADLIEREFK